VGATEAIHVSVGLICQTHNIPRSWLYARLDTQWSVTGQSECYGQRRPSTQNSSNINRSNTAGRTSEKHWRLGQSVAAASWPSRGSGLATLSSLLIAEQAISQSRRHAAPPALSTYRREIPRGLSPLCVFQLVILCGLRHKITRRLETKVLTHCAVCFRSVQLGW